MNLGTAMTLAALLAAPAGETRADAAPASTPAAATNAVTSPAPSLAPPMAPRRDHLSTWHGEQVSDPWFWLREKQDPAVRAYLEAENGYTAAQTAPIQPFADALYVEMLARWPSGSPPWPGPPTPPPSST